MQRCLKCEQEVEVLDSVRGICINCVHDLAEASAVEELKLAQTTESPELGIDAAFEAYRDRQLRKLTYDMKVEN